MTNPIQDKPSSSSQSLQSPAPPFYQGDASELLKKVEVLTTEITEGKKAIKETKNLVVFGFYIVMLMVAGMIWTAWNERNNSYNSLIEKVDSLQTQLLLQIQNDYKKKTHEILEHARPNQN